jgi:Bardet-Biedl syndrome 2 protein
VLTAIASYSLANGTIGIYDNTVRVWRARSKHRLTSIHSYDYDGDGVPELVSGWSSGKLEIRSEKSGVVLSKDQFPSPLAAITQANYHQEADELICCSVDGEGTCTLIVLL